jgi:superfamily II DNA/RNA helicase
MNELPEFQALGIAPELIPALLAKGFQTPSAIQTLTIPPLLSGEKDLIGQALTGTGKTAAFGLPIIQTLEQADYPQALILAPTRELSIQISDELKSLAGTKELRIAPFFGGQIITIQLAELKHGVDIVVGTTCLLTTLDHTIDKLVFRHFETNDCVQVCATLFEKALECFCLRDSAWETIKHHTLHVGSILFQNVVKDLNHQLVRYQLTL